MLKVFTRRNSLMSRCLARTIQVNPPERSYKISSEPTEKLFSSRSSSHSFSQSNRSICIDKIIQNGYSTDATSTSEIKNSNENSPILNQSHSGSNKSAAEDTEPRLDKLFKSIELEILAYEPSILDSYQWFVITAASHLNINVGKCWSPLKSDKLRFSLLKSAFVHKKHQVQYEVRTYHRFITLNKLTESTADTFLEYIQRNLPEGVGMKITKVEVKPMPESLLK